MYKNLGSCCGLIMLLCCTSAAAEDQQPSNVDITENFFGFGSVENAIEELSLAPGAQVRESNDRTVISIEAERVKWEFPSKSAPQYPSIIKSQVNLINGELDYQVYISCGAEETICNEMTKSYAAHVKDVQKKFSK